MKKLFTLFASLALCASAFAQEEETTFSFCTADGTVIPNGSVVTTGKYSEVAAGMIYNFDTNIFVKNNTSRSQHVTLILVDNDGLSNWSYCVGGSCIPQDDNGVCTNSNYTAEPNAIFDPECHDNFEMIDDPLSYKRNLTMSAIGIDEDDVTTITVKFDCSAEFKIESGINDVKASANGLKVYNICGQYISASTEGLGKGMYVIKQNGTSHKVVIR
ncbi:MAG: hypothetical protein KBT20_10260 [Bacteroidales bacterium]|nr:hypothetical protein [Candidatus Liminaster caballi]